MVVSAKLRTCNRGGGGVQLFPPSSSSSMLLSLILNGLKLILGESVVELCGDLLDDEAGLNTSSTSSSSEMAP